MSVVPIVLAATDFSPHARHAADRAARIARANGAALSLLHVMPGPALTQLRTWLGDDTAAEARLREAVQAQVNELAQRLRAEEQVAVDALVEEGPTLEATLQAAERLDAQLIAVGARGAGFARRFVLGSTAERLIRRTTRPVLVVRQTPHERYRRVLVAVDFSPWSERALAIARWVAPDARLVLAHAFDVPYEHRLRLAGVDDATFVRYRERARAEATRRLQEFAARAGVPAGRWQASVVDGDPGFSLVDLEDEHDCDLVALGKHGSSMVADLLLGSVTQRVLAEGGADVLIATQGAA
jgi:nucleotide-binding universal stress UspA family protein